jgi:RHS repeat-associated protein
MRFQEWVLLCCLGAVRVAATPAIGPGAPPLAPRDPGDGQTASRWTPLRVGDSPTTEDICAAVLFDHPLMPVGEPTDQQNQDLLLAVQAFARRTVRDDFSGLTAFLALHPENPWAIAVETQLGQEFYRSGRYSRAMECWKHVWESSNSDDKEVAVALSNQAASQLAMMYARLGRMGELRFLLGELQTRSNRGKLTRELRSASEGLWSMEHRPEVSFRCGPLALDRICFATDRTKAGNQLIQDSRSTTNGLSAKQVAELSRRLGMNYQVAFRNPGAEIIVPAVVHWKVGHYAALIARDGSLLRADDPTFGNSKVWLSDTALDDEASGYFLVRSGPLPERWRAVSDREASQVWGKGTTANSDEDETLDESTKTCRIPHADYATQQSVPMAQWNVNLLLASHHVEDTPVGYAPPIGPPVYIRASYDSVNGWPLYGLPYSNVAQEWRLNWLAYLTDDPMNPASDIRFAAIGGGALTFTDFNPTNQVFQNLIRNRAQLVRTGTNSYEVRYPDGSKQVFDQPDGSIGTTRRVFMSAVVDASGNAATIQFDLPGRISTITDAIGQKTRFFYDLPTSNIVSTLQWVPPYILTRIMDPFGRTAYFDCGGNGINARLHSITDPIGLTSTFIYEYNPGLPDLGMTNLITPYGTTVFQRGSFSGLYRANWVEITHPNGEKERVEYSEKTPAQIFSSEPLAIVPKGVPVRNFILWARNTYYWDRKAYAEGYSPNDYRGARIYHWTHGMDYNTASGILESFKEPLEHRVWFNYDGQVNPTFVGTSDRPTKIARTLEDGTTQLYQFEYNSLGNPTKAMDPVGRQFTLVYDTNEVDLIEIRQTRAGQNELLLSATYDPQHNPLTIADAGRQTTAFTYNSRGQVLTATNPRGDTTIYSYDPNGYLLAVDGPLPGTNDTSRFTYDTVGRLHTATDPDCYTLTFDYDSIDRPTRITYPDSTYQSITYNRLDPEVLRDRAGRETRLTYDSLRQLVAVQDPLGQVTRFDWCGCGGLDAVIDPMGRMTRWIRDLQGRVSAKLYADGSQIQYRYDTATGWLKSIRDEQNQITQFDCNLDGTLREKNFLNALVPTPAVRLTYDPNYRRLLTIIQDETNLTSYSYQPITGNALPGAGQLASVDGPLPNDTITFAYDELGRVVSRGINGVGSRWSWDPAGRLTQLTNSLGTFGFTYDGASLRLATMNFPNGQHSVFSYFPNQKDQLLQQITHFKPDSTLLSRYTYDYNPLRQVTQSTQELPGTSALQWAFGYDGADRLTNAVATQSGATAESHAWRFDALGNRTDETDLTAGNKTLYNALNQVVATTNAPSPPRSYEWDAEGRMVAFTQATHRTEFSYDGYGRRTRIVEKENGSVVSQHRYVWIAYDLCEERDASGALVLKRFSTHGVRAENGAEIPAGAYFVTRDGLESVREFTDASGAVRAAYSYTPYGRRTRIVGDLDSDLGFAGQFQHRPSGLGLALYRAYDPTLGRWLSRDPLGEGDDLNLYSYAYNDPVNYLDPLGLENSASPLTQDLQGHQDAQAGLKALKQGQKALDIADKLVEKGVKGTAKDLVENAREDAIKSLKPAPPRESYKDTTEKMGNTADASSKDYKSKLTITANQINNNLGQPSASCAGSSKKDDGWSIRSLWNSVVGSDDPQPAKPMPKTTSDTKFKAEASGGF